MENWEKLKFWEIAGFEPSRIFGKIINLRLICVASPTGSVGAQR